MRTDAYDDVEDVYSRAARKLGLHSTNFTKIRAVRNLIAHAEVGISEQRVVRSISQLRAALAKIHGYEEFQHLWTRQTSDWAVQNRATRELRDTILRDYQNVLGSIREYDDLERPVSQHITSQQFHQCRSVRDMCSHPSPPPYRDDAMRTVDTLRVVARHVAAARREFEETSRRISEEARDARLRAETERVAFERAQAERLRLEREEKRRIEEIARQEEARKAEAARRAREWLTAQDLERKRVAAEKEAELQKRVVSTSANYRTLVTTMFPLFRWSCLSRIRWVSFIATCANSLQLVYVVNIVSSNSDAFIILAPAMISLVVGIGAVVVPLTDTGSRTHVRTLFSMKGGKNPSESLVDSGKYSRRREKAARELRNLHSRLGQKSGAAPNISGANGLLDDLRKVHSSYRTWQALSTQRNSLRQDWDRYVKDNVENLPELVAWGCALAASSSGSLTYFVLWPLGAMAALFFSVFIGCVTFAATRLFITHGIDSAIALR